MLYTTFLTVYTVSPNATSLKMVVFLKESGDFLHYALQRSYQY